MAATCDRKSTRDSIGARDRMGARHSMGTQDGPKEQANQSVNVPAKPKNSSAPELSPYAKRSITHRQDHKPLSNTTQGAVSRTRKAKIISGLPSHKPTCSSAPATVIRLRGERQTASNPPFKAKQGTCGMSLGLPRERQSAPLIQPHHQRQATYMMVPVRLKKAGLKLLDPEKVKNLTLLAAATHLKSGEGSAHSHLHQVQASKQFTLNSRHRTVHNFPAKQVSLSRKNRGIPGRRQDNNPSIKQNKTYEDHESILLTNQIDCLVLCEKDGLDSISCNTDQESYNPQTLPQSIANQKFVGENDEVAWIDNSTETIKTDTPGLLTFQTTSTRKEEIILDTVYEDIKEVDLDLSTKKNKVIQGKLLEEENEPYSEQHLSNKKHETEGLELEVESDDITQSQADALNNQQAVPSTKTQSQKDARSSHDPLKKSPRVKTTSQQITLSNNLLKKSSRTNDADITDQRYASLLTEEDSLAQKVSMDFGQSSSPVEENIEDMRASRRQEDTKSQISSRRSDLVRRSQGVLVLTRSSDENDIFIPKLKFEFTPDNSIDWTASPQSLTNNYSHENKEKDPRITKPYTPKGPSFSKSVLKKSSALPRYNPTAGGNLDSASGSFREMSTKDSHPPIHGIVDLSISFQGKYEGDEIPNDIPKILLIRDDSDED